MASRLGGLLHRAIYPSCYTYWMEEMLDEVDAQDTPTGNMFTKEQAHTENVIHRCAVIYLLDGKGGIYLQKHKKSNNRLDHSAGGHVASGESYLTAAKRELFEELGLTIPLRQITQSYLSRERETVHMYGIFVGEAPTNWVFQSNDEVEEVVNMTLIDLSEVINSHPEDFTSGIINTFPLLRKDLHI